MVHAVEKFPDITFKDKTRPRTIPGNRTGHPFQNGYALMRTEANPARKRGWDKSFFKNRAQNGKHSMVQNPVADGGFVNMPLLGITDIKAPIRPMAIYTIAQIPVKLEYIRFQMPLESGDVNFVPFARFEIFPSGKKVLWCNYFPQKVAISFH